MTMRARLEHEFVKTDIVEAFIRRAHQIFEETKRSPTSLIKAKEEARLLLTQFEEFLKSKGLEC
jgi:hypothetical protein